MNHYICKVFDRLRQALRMVPFDAQTDRYAVNQAILIQLLTRDGAAFELWEGPRLILSHVASRPAWRTRAKSAQKVAPRRQRALATSDIG